MQNHRGHFVEGGTWNSKQGSTLSKKPLPRPDKFLEPEGATGS